MAQKNLLIAWICGFWLFLGYEVGISSIAPKLGTRIKLFLALMGFSWFLAWLASMPSEEGMPGAPIVESFLTLAISAFVGFIAGNLRRRPDVSNENSQSPIKPDPQPSWDYRPQDLPQPKPNLAHGSKTCPDCGLINPRAAQKCDCEYHF